MPWSLHENFLTGLNLVEGVRYGNHSLSYDHMPELRLQTNGRDAFGRMSILLQMRQLRYSAEAKARRLLRVLFICRQTLPAEAA